MVTKPEFTQTSAVLDRTISWKGRIFGYIWSSAWIGVGTLMPLAAGEPRLCLVSLFFFCFAAFGFFYPDTKIVIDALSRTVTVARRWPWQKAPKVVAHPFAAIRSIGIEQEEGDGDYAYIVTLRLGGRKEIQLWTVTTSGGKTPDARLLRGVLHDRDYLRLVQMTGLPRVDRVGDRRTLS